MYIWIPKGKKYEIHDYTQTEFGNFGNRGDVDHFQISVKIDGTFIRQGHVLDNIVLLQLFYWYEKLPCQTMQREKIFLYTNRKFNRENIRRLYRYGF